MSERHYLELSQEGEGSHKFYEVIIDGCNMSIRYGRIGDKGRTSTKAYPTEAKAKSEGMKKVRAKTKKGYEVSVQGVRKKRAITRRSVTSTRSSSKKAPVLWSYKTSRAAFGVSINDKECWVGNEEGRIFCLDHNGALQREFKLPDGVKSIVSDAEWLYASCDNGSVYDLTGKVPVVAYEIADNIDIYWIDIFDGVLGVSDNSGGLHVFNHEDESCWNQKSKGSGGWMVRCDEIGVYHGHSGGVTMYDWEDGSKLWHQKTGGVLFGWQEESTVYAGCGDRKVYQIKKTGQKMQTYSCDSSVYSCAAAEDGKFVFAGDSNSSVYAFDSTGKRLWKLGTGAGSALSMQFHNDRLYIVTTNGSFICIDASEEAVKNAQAGIVPEAKTIQASSGADARTPVTQSSALETTTDTTGKVTLHCVKVGSKIRVRVTSEGFNSEWNVQFPHNLREEGAKFVVDGVKEASRGGFYRAIGDIKRIG